MHPNSIPDFGFLRLPQIVGDPKRGLPPIIPVSRSTWWSGVRSGRFPKAHKPFGPGVTVWSAADIRKLVESTTVVAAT